MSDTSELVHEQFSAQARARPDATAIRFRNRAIRYGELAEASDRLAVALVERGLVAGDVAVVLLGPSIELLVAMLALWKARAVYAPVDPTYPDALLRDIADESAAKLVLTHSVFEEHARTAGLPVLCLDQPLPAAKTEPSFTRGQRDDLAYVIYTSGTTGRPKGVLATQDNLTHFVASARVHYGFSERDVFCSLARSTFSISLFELVSPLCVGATLHVFERDEILDPVRFSKLLEPITVLHAGPSLLSSLFRYLATLPTDAARFPHMRHASSGGDVVPNRVAEQLKLTFPNAELFVIYGSTEIACMGCTHPLRRDVVETKHLVGHAMRDMEVRIVDAELREVAPGNEGEICFAGGGIARGYLHRPELTAEKFVELDGKRFYRMGDVGIMHPELGVEMLGRRDYQVKVRGMRIELLGIEQTTVALGLADRCVATVVREGASEDSDAAVVVCLERPKVRELGELRAALATRLPDYMLPQRMFALDKLPLTPNGKLDRKQIGKLAEAQQTASHAPATSLVLEMRLAHLFASELGVDKVRLDDDFFARGGHSLMAVRLVQEFSKSVGTTVSPAAIFEHRTPRALAAYIRDSISAEPKPILLSQDDRHPPLFFVAGINLYRELARELGDRFSVYGVYSPRELLPLGADGEGTLNVVDLAADYLKVLRRAQPHGPYRIGGFSFGGIVAFETAQQLLAAGESVELLVLIDAILPEVTLPRVLRRAARALRSPSYLRERARELWEEARKKLRRDEGPRVISELAVDLGDEALQALDDERRAAYLPAGLAYGRVVRRFPGPVEMFAAGTRLRGQPLMRGDCGFAGLGAPLRVRVLPATHHGLLEQPAVRELASTVKYRAR